MANWSLQFTPKVAVLDEAVVMEVAASVRLFRGERALRDRVVSEAEQLGIKSVAWSITSLGALAHARAGIENGVKKRKTHAQMIDALPLHTLTAARPHLPTMDRMGCRVIGDINALPRGSLNRRFDAGLLKALDQIYGQVPEAHRWIELPDTFSARLELMARVEQAPALLHGARMLLMQLCGWLAARHAGTTAFTLRWDHDTMRAKDAGSGGHITIRTAEPTREIEHMCGLLAEHLAHVELLAPAGDLELIAEEVTALTETSYQLLPETVRKGEPLGIALERLSARFGPERVLRPVINEDYRPEWMCHWQPAPDPHTRKALRCTSMPKPSSLMRQPLPLTMRDNHPVYQGPLKLLLGPHRVEGAWWDLDPATDTERTAVRDYWIAYSAIAGVLWIYQGFGDTSGWFLHGIFA